LPAPEASKSSPRLTAIKAAHTLVWAFFVACIGAIWLCGLSGDYGRAAGLIGIVSVEVGVLALNRGRCPLSAVARRYTDDERSNFDIYIPAWLAAHTKPIFGLLYGGGIALALAGWIRRTVMAAP
jgi:hypothetical protein